MQNKSVLRRIMKHSGVRMKALIAITVTALLSSTGGVLLEYYSSFVSGKLASAAATLEYRIYSHFYPLKADRRYNFLLEFYVPATEHSSATTERSGISFTGAQCKSSAGIQLPQTTMKEEGTWHSRFRIVGDCHAGHITLTLYPLNGGHKQVLYDGFFHEDESIPFEGVQGSFTAGTLKLTSVGNRLPQGEWVSVNTSG